MTRRVLTSEDLDCQECGACCAPDTDWSRYAEVTYAEAERLPERYRLQVLDGELATQPRSGGVRCVALLGELGQAVRCDVHTKRPEACRRFRAGSVHCLAARADVLGLRPL